ncbi:MAG: cysteine peptidase family C39 domain-containing protein [Planctomycetota bacterium]
MLQRLLRRYPLFELLDRDAIDALVGQSSEWEFSTGEMLFQEGTAGAWVHLLIDGRVRIIRQIDHGREVSLGTARSGELIGEYVLLTPHRYTAGCRASRRSSVLRIPIASVREALKTVGIDGTRMKKFIRLHASLNFLNDRPYLGFMPASSALTYTDAVRSESYRAMRTVQGPQLADDRWFLILEGLAVMTKRGETLELGPGDCFGSRSLIMDGQCATVSTLTELTCLTLNRTSFGEDGTTASVCGTNGTSLSSVSPGQQSLPINHAPVNQFPFRSQQSESDCGLAALAMIACILGDAVDHLLAELRKNLPPSGLSLLELRDVSRSIGLQTEVFRVDTDHWEDVSRPFIAHFQSGHYVVVYDLGPHFVSIADPATSQQTITNQRFSVLASGYVIVVKTNQKT